MNLATAAPDQPALMTIEECARFLRISRTHCYTLAADGTLPTVRLGRSVRIRRDRLVAWLERQA
jgi:excisionase family DNA binding protein